MAARSRTLSDGERARVEAMAGYGIPEDAIARVLKLTPQQLRRQCREELDQGCTKANTAVAQSLFRKATGDGPQAVTAAIFWAKTRMGWKETVVNEHGGADGGPLTVQIVRFSAREELARRIHGIARRVEPDGCGRGPTGDPPSGLP